MEIKLLLSLTSIVHCLSSGAAASFYQGESLRLWADLPDEYRKFEDGLDSEVELTDFLPLPTEVEREEFAQKVFRVEDFVPHDGESGTSKLWQNVLRRFDELPASRRVNISLEALSIAFITFACELGQGVYSYCPDPCRPEPCAGKPGVVKGGICRKKGPGLHTKQYSCACSNTFHWDDETMACIRVNICEFDELYPCWYNATEKCSLLDNGFHCQCRRNYMGERCHLPRNPCHENYFINRPAGNVACGPEGQCVPMLGTNIYTCICNFGYEDNVQSDWPDCSVKESRLRIVALPIFTAGFILGTALFIILHGILIPRRLNLPTIFSQLRRDEGYKYTQLRQVPDATSRLFSQTNSSLLALPITRFSQSETVRPTEDNQRVTADGEIIPLDSPVTSYLRHSFMNAESGEEMGVDSEQLDEIRLLLEPRCSSTTVNEEVTYIDESDIDDDVDDTRSVRVYKLNKIAS